MAVAAPKVASEVVTPDVVRARIMLLKLARKQLDQNPGNGVALG